MDKNKHTNMRYITLFCLLDRMPHNGIRHVQVWTGILQNKTKKITRALAFAGMADLRKLSLNLLLRLY